MSKMTEIDLFQGISCVQKGVKTGKSHVLGQNTLTKGLKPL